jgi:hypothetical protein
MARTFKIPKHVTGRTITTRTPYGSTSDMIVTDENILKKITIAENCILLKDDDGYYITNKNRIDNNLADPLRYEEKYRDIVAEKIAKEIAVYDELHKEQTNNE